LRDDPARMEQTLRRAGVSAAGGLLERGDLLRRLDRAGSGPAPVISAPPGSGKTSLLRAWAGRSASSRPVAFVCVNRDEEDPQRFWSGVLDAIVDHEQRAVPPA